MAFTSLAQSNYFASTTFNNKLLFNPSQAGINNNISVNGNVKSPIDNSQGGLAREYAFSVDMPLNEIAGVGVVLRKQSAGLMETVLFNFNYSYALRFRKSAQLRIGISGGFKNARLSTSALIGDPSDPVVLGYNSHPPSLASSFGIVYKSRKLEFQAVLPNLTAKIQNPNLKSLDYEIGQGALAYQFISGKSASSDKMSAIKLSVGGIYYKETGVVAIGGVEWQSSSALNASVQYNSTGIITGEVGLLVQDNMRINLLCSMGGLYSKKIYGGVGVAELHINYNFKKKKNE
jgi:type IX secretion system PorP/SprF family membrane protein